MATKAVRIIGLKDLVRRSVDVPTEHGTLRVYALSAKSIAHLLAEFPIARKLLSGKATDGDFSLEKLVELAPGLVAALIAAGVDAVEDPETRELAGNLDVGTQVALLAGVVEASLPNGLTPFMETINKLMAGAAAVGVPAPSGEASDTK